MPVFWSAIRCRAGVVFPAEGKALVLPPCQPSIRAFSVLHRPEPRYHGHVPLTSVERVVLSVGAGVMAYANPRRADLIATFGESTSQPLFIRRLRDAMLASPTGRRILRQRPRLTSATLSMTTLSSMPPSSLGRTYYEWLVRERVSPDTRDAVRYIDDEECAYVMQRYRESHDFYHALTGLPTVREGEVALKAFEFANTGLPMTGLSVLNVWTLKPKEQARFWEIFGPWALHNGLYAEQIINIYWEEELASNVDQLRQRLGIEKPPDLRQMRKAESQSGRAPRI